MNVKVMIADDNSANRQLLKSLFEGEGWDVRIAENGKACLDMAKTQRPDLIVSEILMPVMDGYTLCRECKSDENLKSVLFVFYTASRIEPKDEKYAIDPGADLFILKPQKPEILIKILIDLLDEKNSVYSRMSKSMVEEKQLLRRHNESIYSKLEEKMHELESANQQLRILEEKYRLSFENVMDVIIMVDTDLKVLSVSPSAERILGYNLQDYIGRSISDLAHIFTPESAEQVIADVSLILKGETIPATIYRLIAKDGTIKYGEFSGSPIKRDGKIIGVISVARDITDRKRAEEAQAESEKKYRLIAEKMTDIVWIMDMNLRTLYISPSIETTLGFSPEERMAQDVHEQLTPASMSLALDVLARELALEQQGQADPEKKITIELEYYHKDGSTRWIENIISGIRDNQGIPIGLHGVSRDITKRRQMEEALRESEKKYRELVDFLPISLFEIDFKGNAISANPAIFETFGYAQSDLKTSSPNPAVFETSGYTQSDLEKSQNKFPIIIPGEQERLARNLKMLVKGEKKGPSEYTGIRKDGSTFPFLIYPGVVMHKGKPVGVRGAIIDLTDRKRIEESLKKSNLSLAEAQRIAHIGNWEWDIESDSMYWSDEIHRIVMSTSQMFDETRETFFELVFPEERELVKKALEKVMNEKAVSEIEHRIVRRDGAVREVRQILEPIIDNAGNIVRVVGIIQDVTEKNQAERDLQKARDQLLQSEKLASIGRLSTGVAHEILNPLNIISMELQILQAMGNMPIEALEELEICTAQISRIARISENLKQISRIPEKKIAMADINDTIAYILSLYATQLKIEGIETEVQYQSDLPIIEIDIKRIEQVILNLISNAADSMEGKEKKVLRIITEMETVSGNEDHLKITIADTGTGIKSEHMLKIFDPFFTTKEQGKGTGLGLSISYGIIHDHGGIIWAENNESGGASFYISLPVRKNIDKNHKL